MLKPYDSYKPMSLPWLTTIPQHWDVTRNKNVLDENKETVGKDSVKYTLLSLTLNGVIARDMISAKGKFPKEFDAYKIVRSGDIIFCLFDIDETPRTVGLSKMNGMLTGAYDVFTPRNINAQYLYYYYLSLDTVKAMKPLYTGLRKVIGVPKFLGTKLPLPPRDEQDQIVRYLDWKVSKINKLINAKKKQIALLQEQKQAIINQAVTKGLNPNVEMKDSGVEWIGDIPISWRTEKNKNIFEIKKRIAGEEGFDVLSVTQQGLKIKDISSNEGQMAQNYSNYQFVYPGDYVMNHMDLLTGYMDCSQFFGVTSPDYRVFSLCEGVEADKEYLLYVLRLGYNRRVFYGLGQGAAAQGRWRLPADNFKNYLIPFPSKDEQVDIVRYILERETPINQLINKAEQIIECAAEYRTRLISDVVTGQIDVRDVEIPEYEAAEEIVEDNTLSDDEILETEE